MDGSIRILRQFIIATIMISALLLILNFTLLGAWVLKGMNIVQSPSTVVRQVTEGLHRTSGHYALNTESSGLLDRNHAWAMLINSSGQVTWSYKLPEDVPESYSLTDVAKFTQSFLADYPVFVWEHSDGLIVIGYPKHSLAKYQHILPTNWVSSFPLRLLILLAVNMALALLLSLSIGSRLIRSIRPLTQGIQALADDRSAFVEPKGILSNLAQSVNKASALLRHRDDSLKKRDEARSNWIAGISHDIRTPLSMVLGHASDLEENRALPSEQRKQAGMIRKQAEKLRSLIHDLNLVSMLEYEMQPLHKKPIRAAALVRQIASDFLNQGLDEHFTLEVEICDESVQVMADERLLERAVVNLVQNSLTHNPEGCQIKLSVGLDPNHLTSRIIVEDNGHGVPAHLLPDLLELPFSAKRQYPRHNGHGLGLPMNARIAKAHQGQLILTSEAGAGFKAELVLPVLRENSIRL